MLLGMPVRNQQKAFLRTLNNFNAINNDFNENYSKDKD